MRQELIDECLERIWVLAEAGPLSPDALLARHPHFLTEENLQVLRELGLVDLSPGQVRLTSMGRTKAREIVRSHRLAERLLVDVLGMDDRRIEEEACTFEHNLTPGIVDSICTLLGHPRFCPHQQPIPDGECCRRELDSVAALVTALSALRVGETATVAYLNSTNFPRIKKLYAFGIVPGVTVELLQRSPAYVLKVEETQVALESCLAEDIFVRRCPNGR
ncbi:MAG TPA: metal-dependent transcriptional regulator [Acidobacteriota bacterium]|nr:metal-dependent transcriptional regulator [Acidobacteriota bacterium]HQF86616.1 metal-dependent transcriptional regulator [Acidobacteriota bacterium]HQG90132.1 metal-dependent transcriptional regulator [Acidobacteriota bacterium]HQK88817.1 metal-dependent transcriptional regulator [Acidobacteriota bacterium]